MTTKQQQVAEATISSQAIHPDLPVTIGPGGTYVNQLDGFKVTIPNGFTAQDYDNAHPTSVVAEQLVGTAALAKICSDYTPGLGGNKSVPRSSGKW